MDNQVLQVLKERRSIKKYKPDQIPEAELEAILEAGMYAANGKAMQSPIMVVVQDKETIETLRTMNAKVMGSAGDPFYGAPTVIVVLADENVITCVEDGSLVIGNLMNAAYSLGIDSCWIHRARQMFAGEEGKELLKKWGIEGSYIGVGHCLLGYRDGVFPKARPRKDNYIYRIG